MAGYDHLWLAAPVYKPRQLPSHPDARDRGVRDRRQAFAGHVIDDIEHPEAAPVGELIVDKVQRPAGIGPCRDQDRGSCPDGTPAGLALAHSQTFLTRWSR